MMHLFSSIAAAGWRDSRKTELSDNSFLSRVLATASPKVIDTGEELRPICFSSSGYPWQAN